MKRTVLLRSLVFGLAMLTAVGIAEAAPWSKYRAPTSQYTIDLPTTSFTRSATPTRPNHVTLFERAGDALIDVYSGSNAKHLSPTEFISQMSQSPQIANITYKAVGPTWFAISGHYSRDANDPGTLIYYAKFVFSSDLSRFAAFEISYSVAEKSRMDPVVMHLEKTLKIVR